MVVSRGQQSGVRVRLRMWSGGEVVVLDTAIYLSTHASYQTVRSLSQPVLPPSQTILFLDLSVSLSLAFLN